MRIVVHDQKRGIMRLVPENADDLWVLYNVIHKDDQVYARSTRIVKGGDETLRPNEGKRVPMFLGVQVERVEFQRGNDRLRVKGSVIEAPEKRGIKGKHHTITVDIGRLVTIFKDEWLHHDIERIKKASQSVVTPVVIVSIDREEACVALLQQHSIAIKAEIRANLPGKQEEKGRNEAISKYFHEILETLTLTWKDTHGLIAVIGPGFLKENFTKYVQVRHSEIFSNIKAIRTVGNGGIAGVKEALRSGILDKVARKMRIIEEAGTINKVLFRISSQRGRVSYGLKDVEKATNYGAVELLLVTDKLLREAKDEERMETENLMRRVEKMKGEIMIINSGEEAGRQLLGLGGIAALLRFQVN